MIDATGASQRRHLLDCESGCVATAGIGGEGMLLRVRVRVAVRAPACNGLRLWRFRLRFRLRFAQATIAPCASKVPATTRQLPAPQAGPHGAAGEPRKDPCYNALKPSRAPSSWARFSVVFSRSGDLSFPFSQSLISRILPGEKMMRNRSAKKKAGSSVRPTGCSQEKWPKCAHELYG